MNIEAKKLATKELADAKGVFKEFREFIARGNVVDLAAGIVIGSAFTSIINSLVNDVVMPPIGYLTGKVDFSQLFVSLEGGSYSSLEAAEQAGAVIVRYGLLINAIINFLVVAMVVFLLVKQVNRLKRTEEDEKQKRPPKKRFCPFCMQEVHDKAIRCPHCTSDLPADSKL